MLRVLAEYYHCVLMEGPQGQFLFLADGTLVDI